MKNPNTDSPAISAIDLLLNDFHKAAARADGASYFGYFHQDAVFLGTDKTERWTLEAFQAFAKPYFDKGQGWTYLPNQRHIALSPDGNTAWFDEQLHNDKYGNTRGSGVLVRQGSQWKITQYVLSFPVPNEVAKDAIQLIRDHEKRALTAP